MSKRVGLAEQAWQKRVPPPGIYSSLCIRKSFSEHTKVDQGL